MRVGQETTQLRSWQRLPLRLSHRTWGVALWLVATSLGWAASQGWAADLAFVTVQSSAQASASRYEGRVQAVRQAVIAAQVPGAVVALNVRTGDHVRAGQVLARLESQAADQGVVASGAQARAAAAQLEVARREVLRKRQLFARNYISQAALDQAEAVYRAARAQVSALSAQTGAARSQAGFFVLRAPFDGVVSARSAELGDMAMPGRPLMTLYDPTVLRVTAAVPASVLETGEPGVQVQLEGSGPIEPEHLQVLRTVDPASLTREVRAGLPAGTKAVPGMAAALLITPPVVETAEGDTTPGHIRVPRAAVVRRAEMTGVYVIDGSGVPLLRQVRLGPVAGDQVELLSGVDVGERVATDVHAATRAVLDAAAGRAR